MRACHPSSQWEICCAQRREGKSQPGKNSLVSQDLLLNQMPFTAVYPSFRPDRKVGTGYRAASLPVCGDPLEEGVHVCLQLVDLAVAAFGRALEGPGPVLGSLQAQQT